MSVEVKKCCYICNLMFEEDYGYECELTGKIDGLVVQCCEAFELDPVLNPPEGVKK